MSPVIANIAATLLTIVTVMAWPAVGQPVVVLSADADAAQVVAGAGGRIIDGGGYAAVAWSEDGDFVQRLYRSGALLVVAKAGASGCFTSIAEAKLK